MKELCSFHPGWNHILLTMMEYFLTFIQAGTTSAHNDERTLFFSPRLEPHPLTMMEDFLTFIQAGTTSAHNDERNLFFSPRLEPHPAHNDGRFPHFHPGQNHILLTMMEELCSSTHAGTTSRLEHILLTMMKYFCTYIHPGGNTSCSQ